MTVALPGGIDANRRFPIAMIYPGAPQMAIGEDVFLFLGEGDGIASGLTVLGFSQGKFSIVGFAVRHDAARVRVGCFRQRELDFGLVSGVGAGHGECVPSGGRQ